MGTTITDLYIELKLKISRTKILESKKSCNQVKIRKMFFIYIYKWNRKQYLIV